MTEGVEGSERWPAAGTPRAAQLLSQAALPGLPESGRAFLGLRAGQGRSWNLQTDGTNLSFPHCPQGWGSNFNRTLGARRPSPHTPVSTTGSRHSCLTHHRAPLEADLRPCKRHLHSRAKCMSRGTSTVPVPSVPKQAVWVSPLCPRPGLFPITAPWDQRGPWQDIPAPALCRWATRSLLLHIGPAAWQLPHFETQLVTQEEWILGWEDRCLSLLVLLLIGL